MGKKQLFTVDFEFHASPRILFPYVHTASGLSEWFAANVDINPEKIFLFRWENETRKAVLESWRMNVYAKFQFLPETAEDQSDPAWFEIRLDTDEITQLTYFRVRDYSDFDDLDELHDLWEGLIEKLKTVVGG